MAGEIQRVVGEVVDRVQGRPHEGSALTVRQMREVRQRGELAALNIDLERHRTAYAITAAEDIGKATAHGVAAVVGTSMRLADLYPDATAVLTDVVRQSAGGMMEVAAGGYRRLSRPSCTGREKCLGA